MRRQNDFGALTDQQIQGRKGFPDSGAIGDRHLPAAFLHRHIIIHPHENPFSVHIQVSHRQLSHKSNKAQRIAKRLMESKGNRHPRFCKLLNSLDVAESKNLTQGVSNFFKKSENATWPSEIEVS